MRALVDGQHDQRNVRKNGGRVDAERDCRHIVSVGCARQPVRLPRIKQVSEQNRKRHSRQDAPGNQLLRQAAQRRKARDEKQVRKATEKKAKETVEIARDKPARPSGFDWLDGASDE
jgi:hypothetical protein